MKRPIAISVFALLSVLALTAPGCTAYDAYKKCGREGCEGDAQITQEIQQRFKQHPEFGVQLHVKTTDRIVYLTGQVATDLQRADAESIARGVPQVREVINNIALSTSGR
jgi:osmotically-inducible protein OsmY